MLIQCLDIESMLIQFCANFVCRVLTKNSTTNPLELKLNKWEFIPEHCRWIALLSKPMGVDYVVIGFDMEVQPLVYPQCSLTFLRERYLHRCCEQSFAICAYAMSAFGIDVVSSHTKYSRIAYGITR